MGDRGYQEGKRKDKRNWEYLESLKRRYGTTNRRSIRSMTKNYTVNYSKTTTKK